MTATLTAAQTAHLFTTKATGASSSGMLTWLIDGGTDPKTYRSSRPMDSSDLHRCQQTFDALPADMQANAAALMAEFTAEVADKDSRRARQRANNEAATAARRAESAAEVAQAADAAPKVVLLTAAEVLIIKALLADSDLVFERLDEAGELGMSFDAAENAAESVARKLV